MNHYLTLLRLRNIAARMPSSIICKAKKYLKAGQKPPANVKLHKGPRGGTYYNTEDVHAANGTTPKKRLPAFRKQENGELHHNTKEGEHGPGTYKIQEKDGQHHLSFLGKDGEKHLGSHADPKELKRQVAGFKESNLINNSSKNKSDEIDNILAGAQKRFNDASDWWKQKHPDPKEMLTNAEKARLKELLGETKPEEIPDDIWWGENEHRSAYPGDNGIHFEPIEE